ncbi:MAG: DUF4911 domain-containing protein [Deltaproteobacteria bacterium]|nr:DUF4911 domain-containing protein [Deltaproteobacteria bacterium]
MVSSMICAESEGAVMRKSRRKSGMKRGGRRPCPEPDRGERQVYVQLAREDVARFKFLLESYDNLAYLTTIDRFKAVVRISTTMSRLDEVREFLGKVGGEMLVRTLEF